LVAREGDVDTDWTSHNNRLFERPLYKRTRFDLEGEPKASPPISESAAQKAEAKSSPPNAMVKKPLTSSLGEALQHSIRGKS